MPDTLHEDEVRFVVTGDIKSPNKRYFGLKWCQTLTIIGEVQILRERATILRCYVVSPTHRPPLPPGNIPGTHFC
jgi:hypothetical protein